MHEELGIALTRNFCPILPLGRADMCHFPEQKVVCPCSVDSDSINKSQGKSHGGLLSLCFRAFVLSCFCAFMCVRLHVQAFACACFHACFHMCFCARFCAFVRACSRACFCACDCGLARAPVRACMHACMTALAVLNGLRSAVAAVEAAN